VKYRDKETGTVHEVALVYPHEADISRKRVSILAPVGIARLGLSVGLAICSRVPDGRAKNIEVLAITFQPESERAPKRQAAEYSSAA
jgi:regulator of nucleoside diphosphate kinase